jgi:alpha-ribazole phosphatase
MTSSLNIDLLRHGETEGGPRYRGSTDDPLTAAGWDQMWAAVDDTRWQGIVSSPLSRCAHFAQALAERHSLELRIDARLREMHFGDWEGRDAAEIMQTDAQALDRFWRDPVRYGPTRGESLSQLQARVLAAWHDIVAEQRALLVITHGGPIRVIVCHERGEPIENLLQIDVPHASLWRLPISTFGARERRA